MNQTNLILPAIRGVFGEWIYYSTFIKSSYKDRFHLVEEVYPNLKIPKQFKNLDKLFTSKYSFPNCLIFAVKPDTKNGILWNELVVRAEKLDRFLMSDVDAKAIETASTSLGFLTLSGKEKIFCIKGMNTFSVLREKINTNEIPVLLVAHTTKNRTTELYNCLNGD